MSFLYLSRERVLFPPCFSLFLSCLSYFDVFALRSSVSSISVNFPPFFRVHLCLVCQSRLCVHSLFAPSCLCQFVQCNSPEPFASSFLQCLPLSPRGMFLVLCFLALFPLLLLVLCFSLCVANLYFGILPFVVLG